MKIIVYLCLSVMLLFACSGDCLSCHPTLKKSINTPHHKILNSCIKCHTKLPEGMTSCGGDCFQCHSQNKLIESNSVKEHTKLKFCKECHVNNEDLFEKQPIDNSTNLMNLLLNK